jgi:hypothetical protein
VGHGGPPRLLRDVVFLGEVPRGQGRPPHEPDKGGPGAGVGRPRARAGPALPALHAPRTRVGGRPRDCRAPSRRHLPIPITGLLHKDPGYDQGPSLVSAFYLQIDVFKSGAEGIRTPDLRRAKAALSRLSYGPVCARVFSPVPPRQVILDICRYFAICRDLLGAEVVRCVPARAAPVAVLLQCGEWPQSALGTTLPTSVSGCVRWAYGEPSKALRSFPSAVTTTVSEFSAVARKRAS